MKAIFQKPLNARLWRGGHLKANYTGHIRIQDQVVMKHIQKSFSHIYSIFSERIYGII
jgi:hypothetical protein